MRLFVAIPIPPEIQESLAIATRHLAGVLPGANVSWTRPGNFHLTIRFLGEVDGARMDALSACLAASARQIPRLHLRWEQLGVFPHLRRPRVLWAGIKEDTGHLAALAAQLAQATAPFSTAPVEDRFAAHVTLGRIRQIATPGLAALVREISGAERKAWGAWEAEGLQLFESELHSSGSRHTVRFSAAFANGAEETTFPRAETG
jgi:2'-5' RNA ligase